MSKIASEGNLKVFWVPVIANKAAPTVAEIGAGTNLTPFLPTAGVDEQFNENNASLPMLDEGFISEQVGTFGASFALTFVRDDVTADDDVWTLFDRGMKGFILVSPFGLPIATKRVRVYPVQAHNPVPLPPAENEFQQARVTFAVHEEPDLKAVVAA